MPELKYPEMIGTIIEFFQNPSPYSAGRYAIRVDFGALGHGIIPLTLEDMDKLQKLDKIKITVERI